MTDYIVAGLEGLGTLITIGGMVWHLSSRLASIEAQLRVVLAWVARREEREEHERLAAIEEARTTQRTKRKSRP